MKRLNSWDVIIVCSNISKWLKAKAKK